MGITTNGLPYPEATDPADVPTDMRQLAEAVDVYFAPALRMTTGNGLQAKLEGGAIVFVVDGGDTLVIWPKSGIRMTTPNNFHAKVESGALVFLVDGADTSPVWPKGGIRMATANNWHAKMESGNLVFLVDGVDTSQIWAKGGVRLPSTSAVVLRGELDGAVGGGFNSLRVVIDGSNYRIPVFA
jgi:hypothetical protein